MCRPSAAQENRSTHAARRQTPEAIQTTKQLFEWVTNELDFDPILEFYTGTPESGWLPCPTIKDGNQTKATSFS